MNKIGLYIAVGISAAFLVSGCGKAAEEPPVQVSFVTEESAPLSQETPEGNAYADLEVAGEVAGTETTEAAAPAAPSWDAIEGMDSGSSPPSARPQGAGSPEAASSAKSELDPSYDRKVQIALSRAGFYKGAIDGIVGQATRQAIKEFQSANQLNADGLAGKKTWEKLQGWYYGSEKAE